MMKSNPRISAARIAQQIGITPRAVEKQINALRKAAAIRHIGPAKGGHWEVLQ
jgi:ATP-dependent DNA helicase RecG